MHNGGRLRVLLLNDHLGWNETVLHGVSRLFLSWVPLLEQAGCDVRVCILRREDALYRHFRARGVEASFLGRHKFNPLTLLDLLRIIREDGVHVMHAQGYGATNFARLAGALTGVPVLVHFHDTSAFYPWYQWVADGILNRAADAALAVSHSVKGHCLQKRNVSGLDPDAFTVLHNCVTVEEFGPLGRDEVRAEKVKWGIDPAAPVVGTVTRFFESKGNRFLVEAAAEVCRAHPGARFVLAGDGPQREELRALADASGMGDRIVFPGFCPDPRRILWMLDVMVIASTEAEGLPLTALEAMAIGAPLVVTSIVEVIEDGATGLVVPPRDAAALARAIRRLLEDPALAGRLAGNARERSREFDARAYVHRLVGIYRDLIRRSGPSGAVMGGSGRLETAKEPLGSRGVTGGKYRAIARTL